MPKYESYTTQLRNLGKAMETMRVFADRHANEGPKARVNHAISGLLASLPPVDKSLVLSEMSHYDD